MATISGASRTVHEVRKLGFFSSIRTKFVLTCLAVVAVVLILINTYFLITSRNMIFSTKQIFLQSQASLVAGQLVESSVELNFYEVERIETIVSHLEIAAGINIVITDDSGEVLYDPSGESHREDFPIERIVYALDMNDVFHSTFFEGTFSSTAITPVVSRGVPIGAVYLHEVDTNQGTLLLEMQDAIRNISVIVAVSSIVLVTLIIASVMRRVSSIMNAVKTVREGEYSYMVAMNGRDELAVLGDEFNSLTERLKETDEVRRRFVADASHELRTPLAAIRLLADSILQNEDIDRETVQEFIGDIGAEAERLTRMTGELMALTKLDSHVDFHFTCVDMKETVEATLRMLMPIAQSRGISLTYEISEGCFIHATDDSVHQIIFNLIENAIKYNQPDGSVFVKLSIADGDKVVFEVKDRGMGIPDEDFPHIFDRFYRVDKARSREAGGSGLGLSIVRDTVRRLGGKVSVRKRESGGTVFTVTFKLITIKLTKEEM